MKKEELVQIRDGFQELIYLINEALNIDSINNKELKEQKEAMIIYKLLKLTAKLK